MTSIPDIESSPTVHDPIHRVAHAFEREGENLWVLCWFEPDAHLPEHFHPMLEEHWEVLDGTIQLKLDGHWRSLTDEDAPVRVAAEVRHAVRNLSGRPARARARVSRPGTSRSSSPTLRGRARRRVHRGGLPTSLRNAAWITAFAQRHRHETVMTSPPPALRRIVLPILARFAR